MKTHLKTSSRFEKASSKSTEQIKAACNSFEKSMSPAYEVRHNGAHIWVELPVQQKKYWSPMLHLKLKAAEQHTYILGEMSENPLLWVAFLAVKLSSIGIFLLSGVIAWYKYQLAHNFNPQLFVMFGMVSVWFAVYLLSERYKRKGAQQMAELREFVETIA